MSKSKLIKNLTIDMYIGVSNLTLLCVIDSKDIHTPCSKVKMKGRK